MAEPFKIPAMQPGAVPTEVSVTSDAENKVVALFCATPAGTNYYILPPDTAEQIAEFLQHHARLARTGIAVVQNGQLKG